MSVVNPAATALSRPCPVCTRDWGTGISCQFCGQVEGLPAGAQLASAGRRLGGYFLEGLLFIVTLGIGWLIWSIVLWGRGQTPAKSILNMRVIAIREARAASRGKMFLREFIAKGIIGFAGVFVFIGLILNFWLLFDKNRQELWDKMVDTVVIHDERGVLDPRPDPRVVEASIAASATSDATGQVPAA